MTVVVRAVQLVRGPSAAQMERASSLPIQIAFEPLGAGLAGLVTAGAVQAATELPEVVDVGGEEGPDTGREEQADHQRQRPGHQASHGLAAVVGLPPVGPDEPHDAQDQGHQAEEAPRGANRINTTRTRATTPMTSAAVPMPLRRGRAVGAAP